jgi:Spy/CpxP family protein refolding chaperone
MKRCAVVLLCVVVLGAAQQSDAKDPRAIIQKVKIYRLVQELDLTTEQSVQFFPKLEEMQKIEQEFNEQRMEILDQLKDLVNDDGKDAEISNLIAQYEEIHRERAQKHLEKMGELWKILTPVQQAKYLLFEEKFNREIREMIKQVKDHRKLKP